MDRKLLYPAYGALLLAAAAFGVHVGHSAIGQINPLYFQGAAVHPRDRGVVVDEAALVEQGPRFAQLYGWDQGNAARNADCVNCDALNARDAYAGRNVYSSGGNVRFAVIETGFAVEPQPAAFSGETEQQPGAADVPEPEAVDPYAAQRAEVARYSSYAIEAAPDPAEPAIEAPVSHD